MMKRKRRPFGILSILILICLMAVALLAEDYNFEGKWTGELGATAPAAPGGGGGGGGGGGARGGGGGFGGGGGGGPQKITLRVSKVSKDKAGNQKATGNFTMGSAQTEDVREGKIMGNKLVFKTGLPPATIYEYEAVMLVKDELSVTRTAEGGRGRPTTFTVKRSK